MNPFRQNPDLLDPSAETVILIHGLGGGRLDMWPIARKLRQHGLQTWNWSYRSFWTRIESHVERLLVDLKQLDDRINAPFHIVTHSMGGILTRAALSEYSPNNLQRVLMLAPPHQGSHVARIMAPWFGWLLPTLEQLSDAPHSFVRQLPNPLQDQRYEFAIVEAAKDRVIAQGGVQLDGHKAYTRINGHHGILTYYPRTVEVVESFITSGQFSDEKDSSMQHSTAAGNSA